MPKSVIEQDFSRVLAGDLRRFFTCRAAGKAGNRYAKEVGVMENEVVVRVGIRRAVLFVLLLGCIFSSQTPVFAVQSVTLAWSPSADTNVVGYNIYYGVASRNYTGKLDVGNALTATVSNLVEGTTYYFAATAYNSLGMESDYSNETSYTVPGGSVNQPPTLNLFSNLTINEDAGLQTVGMSGITTGATNEIQTLTITATSSNPGLIPNPTVNYTSPAATGTLTFTPVANAYGSATITVIANDGQATNNTITCTFTVTVNAVNDAPTLNSIGNLAINEDAGLQTVGMSGITTGATNEIQTLTITATSSNPGLIPNPTVSYTSPAATGTLTFTPVANANGSATITVIVNDGQAANNTITRTFTVTVNAVNDAPTLNSIGNLAINQDAGLQTVGMSGITTGATNEIQTLTITATSSNPGLIPNPTVNYTSPAATGTLTFTPVAAANGSATITVIVNDGQAANNTITRTFTVTVNARPTISAMPNQTIATNSNTGQIAFTISDRETPAASLVLSSASSLQSLLPTNNIAFGGSGSNRTVVLTPVSGQSGTATVSITVSDGSLAASTTFQLNVLGAPTPPPGLMIITNGAGIVTPALGAQPLTMGKAYTVTAIPSTGQVFAGWSGSFSTLNPKLTFLMTSNLVLQANFVPNPFSATKGTYTGLFFETNGVQFASAGSFAVSVTSKGTYTGRLQMGSARYSFKGALNLQCQATNVITRKNASPLTLSLEIVGSPSEQVYGEVTDGTWIASLEGDKAVFNSKTNPAPFAGRYTMQVPGQEDGSADSCGSGFGTVQISSSGAIKFAGVLADGTKVSQGVPVSKRGNWPLFAPLYSGKGLVASWLTFTNRTGDDLTGDLSWIKLPNPKTRYYPNGITNDCTASGSAYIAPVGSNILNLASARIEFSGGNLSSSFTNLVALGLKNKVTNTSSNALSMSFTLSTGKFAGKVKDPETGRTSSFSGVVLPKMNAGCGFLLGTNQSAQVVFAP